MKKQKAWIHCRVSDESRHQLLLYQERRLIDYCESENLEIIGITKEVSTGKNPKGYYISAIETMARRHEIDYVVVYDWTRLLIEEDMFIEFKLFCELHGIEIIDIELKSD